MKIIKYLFLLILIAIIGALIYVATINGHSHVEKTITVKAPQELVFNEVNNLKNWKNWAVPQKISESLTYSYPEKTIGKNAQMSWQSDSLNNGTLVTKIATHNSSIKQKATLESRFGATDYNLVWSFEKQTDSTEITLQIKGRLGFWSKAYQIFQDSTVNERLKPRVNKILKNFKTQVLKKMTMFSVNVDGESKTESKNYIYTSQASKNNPEVIAEKRQEALKKLKTFLSNNKLTQNGPSFMVFNTIDRQHGNVILSVAIPVDGDFNPDPDSTIIFGTLPGQRVIKSTLKGNYSNIPKLWQTTKIYMQKHDLEEMDGGKPYEVFVSGPENSENPADWITQLFVPIQSSQIKENDQLGI